MYVQHSEGMYVPLPSMQSISSIPPGIYALKIVEINGGKSMGLMDIESSMLSEPIIPIENQAFIDVISFIDAFEKSKHLYETMKIAYRAGVLLYGKEGTGKTMLARNIALNLKEKGYITIFLSGIEDLSTIPTMMRWIRHAMPNQLFCIVMDEFESYIQRNEQDVLRFLDGGDSQVGCVSIAITNFKQILSPRLLRPSRFGLIREIPVLDISVIQKFIRDKLTGIVPDREMFEFMNKFDGGTFTIDQVKDAMVKRFILGEGFYHSDFDIEQNRTV